MRVVKQLRHAGPCFVWRQRCIDIQPGLFPYCNCAPMAILTMHLNIVLARFPLFGAWNMRWIWGGDAVTLISFLETSNMLLMLFRSNYIVSLSE